MLPAVHGAALARRVEREQGLTGCAWVLEGHGSIFVARGFFIIVIVVTFQPVNASL